MTLAEHFELARTESSDINEHLDELVRIAARLQAKRVIELGVRFGTSTIAWLHALSETDGHLWSVDVEPRYPPWLDDQPHWTFIPGYDLDLAVMNQLPEQVDIIFVDTDHRYELTRAEIQTYIGFVRPGGSMVFHDTAVEVFDHHVPGTEPPFPVQKAVSELLGDRPWRVWDHNNGLTEVSV